MRTTGPARTTGLLTKGGSLPGGSDSRGEVSGASREKGLSNEATRTLGNRREQSARFDAATSKTSASLCTGNTSLKSNLSLFLTNAIMELVAKSKPKNDFSGTLKPPLPFSAEGADGDQPPSICENEQDILCESAIAETACTQFPTWKRVFDLACIFLSLPFWLPLTILVMLWIKFASPGPIFYRQERIGYRGRRFFIWKFRTMMVSAETETHERYFQDLMRDDCPMTKLDASGDPRLVRGGRLLRASGVDELPQIVNVLRGEMSLVGPRPCTPHEFQSYQNWQKQRVNAPPGLTGFWQVNGKNKTTFSEMIAMDIFYAKKMSLWLDLKIMLKTIPAVGEQILEARSLWRGGGGRQAFRQTAPLAENFVGPARKA